ncbi:MAG: CpsD/CapB family tyrosine-protein kinase [Bacilli bacterium]|nr:CpsD/CapB family tyrosine-protein kinase [Bacilli bacterium]
MYSELVLNDEPKAVLSETIRTLRTNLQFASVDKELHTILITSSMPGEGKSFIAANLAVAFAQSGSKVLLVDCDIRKGRQHYIFGSHNKKGLSNLLLEDIKTKYNEYINETKIKNLSVMFRGMTPPNPSELLGSDKNKELVSILKANYDIVIYDSAPINAGLTDSLIMSRLVDGVVIVSACKSTPKNLLMNTKKSLQNVNANILGVVLNRANGGAKKYYGHYYG